MMGGTFWCFCFLKKNVMWGTLGLQTKVSEIVDISEKWQHQKFQMSQIDTLELTQWKNKHCHCCYSNNTVKGEWIKDKMVAVVLWSSWEQRFSEHSRMIEMLWEIISH